MLLATLGFTIMQVLVKELSHLHISQIVFFRSSITALICISYLKSKDISLLGKQKKLLMLRAFFGLLSMTLFFLTVQRIPLGASVSLKYLSPIFTAVFAVLFIKEKIKPFQWGCFALALTGVFLLKGFDNRIDDVSFVFGVLGAVLAGLVYIIIRKIGKSEHPLVIVNYFMFSAATVSLMLMPFFWIKPSEVDFLRLIGMGVFGYFGQMYMTKSFQQEAASRVAPIKYTELIYSLIIGLVWFGETYTILSFVGIILILTGMFLNLVAKR